VRIVVGKELVFCRGHLAMMVFALARPYCPKFNFTTDAQSPVVRNYSRGLCFRSAFIKRSRARAHPRDGILMMQASQDRFREYEHTRRQSMSGFGLRDYRSSRRRIGYARA
jgi:hypothetical protein